MMKRRRLMEEPTAPAADRVDPLEDLKKSQEHRRTAARWVDILMGPI